MTGHFGDIGGAERQALHLIRYLRVNANADVAVLGWYGTEGLLGKILRELGCEIFSFPYVGVAPRGSKVWNLLNLARFIRFRIQPDLILPFVSVHSKPICQIWRLTGASYVWWNQQDEGRGLYGTNAERKALLNAVHITSNSWAGTEFIAQTFDIPAEQIHTYNNGTVLPDLKSLQPVWRSRLGLAANTPLVVMAANVTPYKDHGTLLKAWRIVLDHSSAKGLEAPVLALAGHLQDKSHVNTLKVLAFDLGLSSSVRFLGAIDSTDELMYESDLVVHSSLLEGCPNAVCEAMALGKAVIATDIPGTRQALPEALWSECLADASDAQALAARILVGLTDKDFAERCGTLNHQRIRNEFSIEKMCRFLMALPEAGGAASI